MTKKEILCLIRELTLIKLKNNELFREKLDNIEIKPINLDNFFEVYKSLPDLYQDIAIDIIERILAGQIKYEASSMELLYETLMKGLVSLRK